MLVLVRVEERDFTNSDRNLGMVIANQAAIMLQNDAMVGSLQRFSEQTIAALIAAIESKDPYTRGHSERVQNLAVKLAGAAASQSQRRSMTSRGGRSCTTWGRSGSRTSIICKAGVLTDDEYTMIKTHPERSYEILQKVGQLSRGALDAARYHHERFDGNGYPEGLCGKAIPVESRVIAVADTYDALTSSRSYRARKDHEAAMAGDPARSPEPSSTETWSRCSTSCASRTVVASRRLLRGTTATMAEVARSRVGATTHLFPDGPLNDPERVDAFRRAIAACESAARASRRASTSRMLRC